MSTDKTKNNHKTTKIFDNEAVAVPCTPDLRVHTTEMTRIRTDKECGAYLSTVCGNTGHGQPNDTESQR